MLEKLINHLQQFSCVGIFGYGAEGKSTYAFLEKHLKNTKLVIIDKNNGENYLDDLEQCELIIKSPGISLYNLGLKYESYNFTSATELFLYYFSKQIIGVTGTKGKSTLSSLLFEVISNSHHYKAVLCGNIGVPVFDIIEDICDDTIVVMELSSHQLEHINASPHIAILTNIYQDHLDYYSSYESYIDAKLNIFSFQNKDDIVLLGNLENQRDKVIEQIKSKTIIDITNKALRYSKSKDNKSFIHPDSIKFTLEVATLLSIDKNIVYNTIENFTTLPHRLEYFAQVRGIEFYNDSISTIPEAAINAMQTLKNVHTLLIGGFNRGIDYSKLINYLCDNPPAVLILFSDVGLVIQNKLQQSNYQGKIIYVSKLHDSINVIFENTPQNSICLFSPAASSFDEFSNFKERGDFFKQSVLE